MRPGCPLPCVRRSPAATTTTQTHTFPPWGCRAGADEVYGAEISPHMCEAADEALLANGLLGRVSVLSQDARRMDVVRKPDGTPPDLPRRADVLVYEVRRAAALSRGSRGSQPPPQ